MWGTHMNPQNKGQPLKFIKTFFFLISAEKKWVKKEETQQYIAGPEMGTCGHWQQNGEFYLGGMV